MAEGTRTSSESIGYESAASLAAMSRLLARQTAVARKPTRAEMRLQCLRVAVEIGGGMEVTFGMIKRMAQDIEAWVMEDGLE